MLSELRVAGFGAVREPEKIALHRAVTQVRRAPGGGRTSIVNALLAVKSLATESHHRYGIGQHDGVPFARDWQSAERMRLGIDAEAGGQEWRLDIEIQDAVITSETLKTRTPGERRWQAWIERTDDGGQAVMRFSRAMAVKRGVRPHWKQCVRRNALATAVGYVLNVQVLDPIVTMLMRMMAMDEDRQARMGGWMERTDRATQIKSATQWIGASREHAERWVRRMRELGFELGNMRVRQGSFSGPVLDIMDEHGVWREITKHASSIRTAALLAWMIEHRAERERVVIVDRREPWMDIDATTPWPGQLVLVGD